MGSILDVCVTGAPASMAVETDAGVTVSVAEVTSELSLCFLQTHFSVVAFVGVSSPDLRCLARPGSSSLGPVGCQTLPGLHVAHSLHVSLHDVAVPQLTGCPVGLLPEASSPYRRSLGMQASGMWWTCPSQRSPHCLISMNMLSRPAQDYRRDLSVGHHVLLQYSQDTGKA